MYQPSRIITALENNIGKVEKPAVSGVCSLIIVLQARQRLGLRSLVTPLELQFESQLSAVPVRKLQAKLLRHGSLVAFSTHFLSSIAFVRLHMCAARAIGSSAVSILCVRQHLFRFLSVSCTKRSRKTHKTVGHHTDFRYRARRHSSRIRLRRVNGGESRISLLI